MTSAIHKIFKIVHPELRISKDSVELIKEWLHKMIRRMVDTNKPTIYSMNDNLKTFGDNFVKHIKNTIRKNFDVYHSESGKININISVLTVNKLTKSVRKNVKWCGPEQLFLATVLDYFIAEMCEVGGNIARNDRKMTMKPEHLEQVLEDSEYKLKWLK